LNEKIEEEMHRLNENSSEDEENEYGEEENGI
jgi:hypothetical protein